MPSTLFLYSNKPPTCCAATDALTPCRFIIFLTSFRGCFRGKSMGPSMHSCTMKLAIRSTTSLGSPASQSCGADGLRWASKSCLMMHLIRGPIQRCTLAQGSHSPNQAFSTACRASARIQISTQFSGYPHSSLSLIVLELDNYYGYPCMHIGLSWISLYAHLVRVMDFRVKHMDDWYAIVYELLYRLQSRTPFLHTHICICPSWLSAKQFNTSNVILVLTCLAPSLWDN